LTREPFQARLYPKDALLGRLDGAKTSPALLVKPRRILHLFLVLLVAGGVSLFFFLGPPGGGGRSTTPKFAISQRLELDGNVTREDADEIITMAAVSIEPMGPAVPVALHEDGLSMSTVSAAYTVGEVLAEKGIVVNEGDYLFPSAGSLVTAGTHIYVYHARELYLSTGGDTTTIHSREATVADVLEEADVSLGALDRVEPALDAPAADGMTIRVVRVQEELETVDEVIPCAVVYQDDPTMDMGQYMVLDWGADGLIQREYRVVYEDDQEIERELLSEWEQAPRDQVIAEGTKPVNLVDTPLGPLRYSYSLEMYATWYRPIDCGKSPDSPWYGITATGVTVQRGIVAVDPNVIPLGTRLYVPGYGQALAADTGSAVVGNIVDLGFADYEVPDWRSGYVTVYILE
jgi:uncharacterized protein YabE (DUF348 family)/3D (Asp-Asp-Asp) domain-containing protein